MCGVGSLTEDRGEYAEVKEATCRSWLCDTCAPIRRMQCEIEVRSGEPTHFLTLTMDPRIGNSPNHRAKLLSAGFVKLIRWCRKLTGARIEYWCVYEPHKSGEPHLHVALRGWRYIPQKRLAERWFELTGARIVDIRRIDDPGKASRYLAKYIAKAAHKFGTAKRYWKSAGWVLNRGDETEEPWERKVWRYARESVREVVHSYVVRGWSVMVTERPARSTVLWNQGFAISPHAPRGPPLAAGARQW